MADNDVRWLQRYDNFHRACNRMREVTEGDRTMDGMSELELEGLVQRFEYTYELAWKVLQDLLLFKGYQFVSGPNGTLKMAFEDGLISQHDSWRRMAKARNTIAHTYNEEDATAITAQIFTEFAPLLTALDEKLQALAQEEDYQ